MDRKWNVAIIGATGFVGREMLSILEERKFPIDQLRLFSSEQSAGATLEFGGKSYTVEVLTEEKIDEFDSIDIALMSTGDKISKLYTPLIANKQTAVIDNSNAWRMDPSVPLIVPEVNFEALSKFRRSFIVANPNCSTVQMVQVLKPIHDAYKIKRVVVSTYQSTSGKGKAGNEELAQQTTALMNQKELSINTFQHQIAFNCIPHIDVFLENDYTLEEMKMVQETKKILDDDSIQVTATCVRVPVFSSHAESLAIETEKKATAAEIKDLLSQQKGVQVMDDPKQNSYPMNVDATGKDDTFVGRIREDISTENGIQMWVVSDNLRKGAALNAVQIAEALVSEFL